MSEEEKRASKVFDEYDAELVSSQEAADAIQDELKDEIQNKTKEFFRFLKSKNIKSTILLSIEVNDQELVWVESNFPLYPILSKKIATIFDEAVLLGKPTSTSDAEGE